MSHPAQTAIDTVSAGAIIGSLLNYLPPLAAAIAMLWYLVQIYESDTVQGLLHKRRIEREEKKEPPEIEL